MADKRLNLIIDLVNKTEKGFKSVYSNLEAIEQKTKNTTRFMKEAGLIGGAAFAGLSVATKKFLSDAGELEQQTIAFETMLGSAEAAKDMLEELSNFAARTPFELQGIRGTAKQLMAMGIESEKVIPTMKSLGDISAGLSVDLDRVAYNYGQVKTQTKLTGVELKDFMRMGIPLLGALAETLGKSESEIKDMVTAGEIGFPIVEEAFRRMTSEGGQFEDLMFRQSASITGQVSNLQDNLTKLSETIGVTLLPIAKEVTMNLTELTEKLAAWTEKNPELASTILKVTLSATGLLAAMGVLGMLLPRIILGITLTTKALIAMRKAVLLTSAAVKAYSVIAASSIATNGIFAASFGLVTKSAKALWTLLKAHPVGILITVLGFLIYKFVELKNELGTFGHAFAFVWQNIKKIFYDTMAGILSVLDKVFSVVPGMSNLIKDETIEGFRIMSEEADNAMNNIIEETQLIKEVAMDASAGMGEAADQMGNDLDLLTGAAEDSGEAAEKYFKDLVKAIGSIRDEIRDTYQDIQDSTAEFQKSIGQEQMDYETKVVDAVAEAYEKRKQLESDLKKAKRDDDTSAREIENLEQQISEQSNIIESYKDLEMDLDEAVAERRRYLRADEIEQLTMDHEKKLMMMKKEYLEDQVQSLQKLLLLKTEHNSIIAMLDAETRHKVEAELQQESALRTRLSNEKEALNTWMDETTAMYDQYVRDVQSKLSSLSSGGRVKVTFSGGGISARAQGGSVQPTRQFLVGEKGPELFTPSTYGRISGAGGGNVNVYFTGNHFTDERYAEQIQSKIVKDLNRTMKLSRN